MALLGFLSTVLPAAAVIPVHGVAQIGSNAGRFILQFRHTLWPIFGWFSAGCLIGALLGGRIAVDLPVWALRGGVAFFILISLWGPKWRTAIPGQKSFFAAGVIGSFLTMFFGATGPIAATALNAAQLNRLNLVATHAACMVTQHGLKVLIFGLFGFAYAQWFFLIAAMVIAGFAGTALGTYSLTRMPEKTFRAGFRAILTIIAIYLLIAAIIEFRTG